MRDYETLSLIGARLSAYPAGSGFYAAGELFAALAQNHAPGCRVQAVMELQRLSECPILRPRALLALGSQLQRKGNPDGALSYYQQSQACTSGNSLSLFLALSNAATALDAMGEKGKALHLLESIEYLAQIIRRQFPAHYLNYLNSRAVILAELGKVSSALTLSTIVYGSSLNAAYPEWCETHEKIVGEQPRRLVAVPEIRKPSNVLQITTNLNDEKRCEDALYRIGCALVNEHRPQVLESCAVAVERVRRGKGEKARVELSNGSI